VGGGRLYALRNFTSLENAAGPGVFGTVTAGATSAPYTYTVRNTGLRPVPINGVRVTEGLGRPVFALTDDGCSGRSLPVTGACSVTVVFRPSAAGQFEGTIEIDAGIGSTGTVLGGTGIAVPAADKTAPKPTSKGVKGKLKTVLSRGLKVTVGCDEACTVKGSLRLKGKEVAKGTAKGKALTLKFTKAAKKTLAKRKSVKLTLRLTATDTAGNTRTTNKTITVRR
jgi:hypothetical protein